MAANVNALKKNVPCSAEDLENAYYEYLDNAAEKNRAPSLPDYLGFINKKFRARMTEQTVQDILSQSEWGTYSEMIAVLKSVLMGLRGEYLSNPLWAAAQSTKAVLALGRDYGDGIVYSNKDNGKKGPEIMQILFGDSEMQEKAGK